MKPHYFDAGGSTVGHGEERKALCLSGSVGLFTDDGAHVPVTVLMLDNCQVVAVRTAEKDGYTALQLGVGVKSRRMNSVPFLTPHTFEDP
jgi:hypothetical protein